MRFVSIAAGLALAASAIAASEWTILESRDEITGGITWRIHCEGRDHEDESTVAVILHESTRRIAVQVLNHEFPGRSMLLRVDKGQVLDLGEHGTENTAGAIGLMVQGESALFRYYELPLEAPKHVRVSLEDFREALESVLVRLGGMVLVGSSGMTWEVADLEALGKAWDGTPGARSSGEIAAATDRLRCVDFVEPVILKRQSPQYSKTARKAGTQGVVSLEAIIDEGGDVTNVRILRPVALGLDQAAAEALRKWRFQPALCDGVPVSVIYNSTVEFSLR